MARGRITRICDTSRIPPLIAKLQWRLRRLNYLRQRLLGSFALRGWRGTLARVAQEFRARPAQDESLPLEPLDIPFAPFTLPAPAAPQVSVIIPVHGKLAYTLACLRSLKRHGAEASFEVIVVDDASPDDTSAILAQVDGLRLVSNPSNLGFIGSCHAGAAVARGNYLLFLNNDTQVTPGWLDALLRCFEQESDCGIAGSKLVYPDGRLQEAGGLVFSDGSCWNVGRFEGREQPTFRYRREVDYVSGASLLIPRELYAAVGGFDHRYAPAYFEDVDLAFAVRHQGLKVFYEPASVVVHAEGISAGTDLDAGMKRYQAINQATFGEKWAASLQAQPPPGTALPRAMHWRARGCILVADTLTPDASRDSGSLRLIAIMRLLCEDGWHVVFIPDDGRASADEIERLGELGVEIACRPWTGDVPTWLRRHGSELDAVLLSRHTVAGQYIDLVRRHAPQARLLFDTVDLHFLREQRAAELTGNAAMARQAEASRRSELSLIARSDISLVVSPLEQQLLQREMPDSRIELLSNIHAIHGRRRPYAGRRDLVFIGGHGHPPNGDAIRWLAEQILPRLRQNFPDLRIHVLGDMPEKARRELSSPGLELHGRVQDLGPWLDSCLASIAPLRFGAGVKGKINMAMSYGVPVIATAVAVEGMQLHDGVEFLLADDADAYVDAVRRLAGDEALWSRLSDGGLRNVAKYFSAEAARATLRRLLSH